MERLRDVLTSIETVAAEKKVRAFIASFFRAWLPTDVERAVSRDTDVVAWIRSSFSQEQLARLSEGATKRPQLLDHFTPQVLYRLLEKTRPDLARELDRIPGGRAWYERNFKNVMEALVHGG